MSNKRTRKLGTVIGYWAEGYNVSLRQVWAGVPGWFWTLVSLLVITAFMWILLPLSLMMGVPDDGKA